MLVVSVSRGSAWQRWALVLTLVTIGAASLMREMKIGLAKFTMPAVPCDAICGFIIIAIVIIPITVRSNKYNVVVSMVDMYNREPNTYMLGCSE